MRNFFFWGSIAIGLCFIASAIKDDVEDWLRRILREELARRIAEPGAGGKEEER